MMLDEEIANHLIAYIKEQPSSVRFEDYREDSRVVISGNLSDRSWTSSRHDFSLTLHYDKKGDIVDLNGIEVKFDTTPLINAIKDAIKSNFKLKRKINKVKGAL